jgi:purine-binding chemotaxis protein CheW
MSEGKTMEREYAEGLKPGMRVAISDRKAAVERPWRRGKDMDMEEVAQTVRQDLQGAGKYLAFSLGKEEFAVPVGRIREIIPWQEITPVPQAASYVLGVINLRGKVVPVMDLRRRLGMAEAERGARSCIVVMQPTAKYSRTSVGMVVDGVSEVLQIPVSELEDTASLGGGGARFGYVHQIAKCRGKVKLLLEIDGVLAGQSDESERVQTMANAGEARE